MTCTAPNCQNPSYVLNYCSKHYQRYYKWGTLELPEKIAGKYLKCKFCNKQVGRKGGKGMCRKHWESFKKWGNAVAPEENKQYGKYCLGSNCKYPRKTIKGYFRDADRKPIHQSIVEDNLGRKLKQNELVHHIDFNKLNNDINNLYLCNSNSQHQIIHGQLNKIVPDLFKLGIVIFENGIYKINPKYGPDASP